MEPASEYIVLADYEVHDPHPLQLAAQIPVRVLRQDTSWPGWLWVQSGPQVGWIPASYLQSPEAIETVTLQAFDGTDLSARRGDHLHASESAPGWIRASSPDGKRSGWFPLFNLRPV